MDLEAFRKYIFDYVENLNSPRDYGCPMTIKLRDFDNQELMEFIETTLSKKQKQAIQLRFSASKPTYETIGTELGVTKKLST